VREAACSTSPIVTVPYTEAYASGFEDMMRRVPDVSKLERMTGFRPRTTLAEIVSDVVADVRGRLSASGRPRPASKAF
jgi:UDP-glucose 4-epimerase